MYTLVIRYKYSNTVKNLRENTAVMFSPLGWIIIYRSIRALLYY